MEWLIIVVIAALLVVGVIVNWRETARLDRRALDLVQRELALVLREGDLEKWERRQLAEGLSEARRDSRRGQ